MAFLGSSWLPVLALVTHTCFCPCPPLQLDTLIKATIAGGGVIPHMWVSPLFFSGEALPACLRAPRCPACLPSTVVRLAAGPQHQGFCAHYIACPSCLCSHKSLISKQVCAQDSLCAAGHARWYNVWHAPATAMCVRQQPVSPSGQPPQSSVSRAPPPLLLQGKKEGLLPPGMLPPVV